MCFIYNPFISSTNVLKKVSVPNFKALFLAVPEISL